MITTSEMKALENQAELEGTTKLELMERAGEGIAQEIENTIKNNPGLTKLNKKNRILFVCYHGNNGGDGFTAARYLLDEGFNTKVMFIGNIHKLKFEAQTNFERLLDIEKEESKEIFVKNLPDLKSEIIVDAILGISTTGEIKEPIASTIDWINQKKVFKISIDIPTGISPDTGEENNTHINADLVLTMHDIKPGLIELKKEDKVRIIDIGLN
ncbi:NAD(P)H-hydrate epimerase [Candidatus Woesearchaeota archaeon]|jgi:hydroxyethylthiazole kinase-like uncharacterized protein yjeF|nr:NAD(P)H-hydrate epimerase [Candidatus Woesearchaeota archaeon]MBT6518353.1 NAD(P)H-hydrate epimerase [Candidatus Woesearchaeota archaeon]MBT7366650.1 NAD(P)H-hydrate epimerase [Candidatus Woesearchaeota archaeon]